MKTPETNIPWPKNDFIFKEIGTNADEDVFQSVGRALTRWENVESQLGILFKILLESESIAAERVYGQLTSPTMRKQALAQAGEIYYDRHKKEFPKRKFDQLLKDYAAGMEVRNKIAHGMVMQVSVEDKKIGYFLVPAFYSNKNAAKTTDFWLNLHNDNTDDFAVFGFGYRYTSEDIDSFAELFEQLRVFAFEIWESQFILDIKKAFVHTKA